MKTKKLIFASLMAALCCVGTMFIAVPSALGGFIHVGDGFVFLTGIILGPIYGGIAAGIGSMLADIFLGYAIYAPATFIIKALAAFMVGFIYYKLVKKFKKSILIIICGIAGSVIVVTGYFFYEALLYNMVASLKNIPGNIFQSTFGIIVVSLLVPALDKISIIREIQKSVYNLFE